MATGRSYLERPTYIYLGAAETENPSLNPDTQFEFDESELWNNVVASSTESKKPIPNSSRLMKKPAARKISAAAAVDRRPKASSSLPLNIPDWSKILRDEYGKTRRRGTEDCDVDDDAEDEDYRVPPHEYLARTRMASFSVHEGVGRTLKGRDLSRVRNAIWKKTGFED